MFLSNSARQYGKKEEKGRGEGRKEGERNKGREGGERDRDRQRNRETEREEKEEMGGSRHPPLPRKELVFNKLSPDDPVLTQGLFVFETGLEWGLTLAMQLKLIFNS